MNRFASLVAPVQNETGDMGRVGYSPQIGELSLAQQYLRIALRWRWVILGIIAACVALAVVGTLLMTPKYTATATIEISRDSDQVTDIQGVEREVSLGDQEFYQTQYGLLRSRTLAERVAQQLRLVDDPTFFEQAGRLSDKPAFALANGRFPANGREERQRIAGQILLENLSVDPDRLSRLVDLHYTSPDPELAARVANAWGENFIQTNLERKVQATQYGREALRRQLAEYKERLDQSQRQLVAYASQQEIINLPGRSSADDESGQARSIVSDNLSLLNTALGQATAERIRAEARFRQAGRNGASAEALQNDALSNLRSRRAALSSEYERLMVRFEPGYPAAQAVQSQLEDIDRAISREEARINSSIEADYRQALQRERTLETKVSELKGEYLDLNRRSIQYNIYQQEVDTNRSLYDGLLQRFKEIGVAGGVGINNIAIVDLAEVPRESSSPNLLLNLLASLLLGTLLGVAVALGLEQLDETISDPAELHRRLGLPVLGTVPRVENETPREALLDRKSELVDAYLAIQTNLAFTTDHGVPSTLAVTSTRPAEGKSTSALSLATLLARGGRKVILVDGDMRSPSVHHLGGVGHDRGLSNFLAGDDDLTGMTFEMPDLGITAMSAGPIPPNAAELLSGNRLTILLDRLRETFDHVVVDSPPVMGLADAPLIASKVEGLVYAIESHGIRSRQVETALGRLSSSKSRLLGAILTKFEARKSHYGYGYEYGYEYGREAGA